MIITNSETDTIDAGFSFASNLKRGSVVALSGELGAGKTQFVKGVCKYFNVKDYVKSPSFVILHRYCGVDIKNAELFIYHFDLYRIKQEEELHQIGFDEYLYSNDIVIIEWPDNFYHLLNHNIFNVKILFGESENQRLIDIKNI